MPDTPALADFRARYPGFASTADETVEAYLSDATQKVSTAIPAAQQAVAIMMITAHDLTRLGEGDRQEASFAKARAAGVRAITDGPTKVEFERSDNLRASAYSSTQWGQQYLDLLMRFAPLGVIT